MKKLTFGVLGVLAGLTASATPVFAQTISAKRIAATNRLLPLKKITVGPDDQYSSTTDPKGKTIVFSHKADLVANLVIQDLATGEIRNLLPLTADSQEPAFGPDGQVAFNYFKFNARGDVCLLTPPSPISTVAESDIRCLKRSEANQASQRSNPFWKDASQVGYLERDILTQESRIVAEDLKSGKTEVLASGQIWSPSMRPGGKYLAYNDIDVIRGKRVRRIVLQDLSTSQAYRVRLALPGLSGFPVISPDEKHIYFSHFMNDSNDDRAIDGSDNAVIFRLPIEKIVSAKIGEELFPEQLTSSETSCSFPRPSADSVFATCAFEGSLDIYQLSATGVVPTNWDQNLLHNAIQTSRSYEDRILLLNTLKYRSQANAELDEKLLFNHLQADDTLAARFYLDRIAMTAPAASKDFIALLGNYLDAREIKRAQPIEGDLSREFRKRMLALDQATAKIKGEPRFKSLVRGHLRVFLNEPRQAESYLKQAKINGRARPIERYFKFELAQGIYRPSLPATLSPLLEAYQEMMRASELSEESQIYYAFNMLKTLSDSESSLEKRISVIEQRNKELPASTSALLKSEAAVLKLISTKVDKDKQAHYRDLDKLMSETRGNYFLRKALYVRAILNFNDAAEFKFLSLVASNWLRYTPKDDTEFIFAREVVSESSLDQAYSNLAKKNYTYADNYFYQSISLTDDLESHYGYIQTLMIKGERQTIDRQYQNLKQREFITDNMKFVEALLTIIDAQGKAAKDLDYTKHLKIAIEKLDEMQQDRDSPVRYLLLGYSQLELMLRTSSGLDFDGELFATAHRNLMLAYDLGRDNDRVKVSALMNLGILHLRAQNPGLAARFFSLRKKLPIESDDEQAQLAWLYARALTLSRQPAQAADEIAALPVPVLKSPLLERQAFSSSLAGRFSEAAKLYEKLLQSGDVKGEENLAKVNLMYGYSLLRAGQNDQAAKTLVTALDFTRRLKPQKRNNERFVDFHPVRLEVVASGLLAQATSNQAEKRNALERRAKLLESNQDVIDEARPAAIQTHVQLADLLSTSDLAGAKRELDRALELAEELGDESQFVSHAIFRATVSYLSHGVLHPQTYSGSNLKRIKAVVEKSQKAYASQKIAQPMLEYQRMKVAMLWAGFSNRVMGAAQTQKELDSMLQSVHAQQVKSLLPPQWSELEKLRSALQ